MEPIIAIVLVLVGYALGSAKLINEGNEALVERMGRYHRKLKPGLNFIVPVVDQVVMEDTTREQILDIQPQKVITSDNVYLEVDGVVSWRITDMEKSYYKIDDINIALKNLAMVELRSNIADRTLSETITSRSEMNTSLLQVLNQTTVDWGVQIIRVDIQSITPPESVQKSMAEQQAAEIRKRAAITDAQALKEAATLRAEATKAAMQKISEALRSHPDSRDILKYLVAQDYVQASQALGASDNAKIIFMNPGESKDIFNEIIADEIASGEGNGRNKAEN
ncbi:MAG: SPFH/Band 7/PHB domain protein [Scytonematopsis contorta HA4267-MV1]|jgi:regulator of protease activity HflC (stomatin/prohibitin superfamily)|nr:SPFH/Band 7/PHB domain protein [Scytonematopsis contorta HA4267-MV1]